MEFFREVTDKTMADTKGKTLIDREDSTQLLPLKSPQILPRNLVLANALELDVIINTKTTEACQAAVQSRNQGFQARARRERAAVALPARRVMLGPAALKSNIYSPQHSDVYFGRDVTLRGTFIVVPKKGQE
ncbi:hypothetical protein CERSUDRAFT_99732 [Gelatoporia subvermispora B]|uniref:Uncharacterized protein n=1 Tax=Ceriporiopsis subvermispora (strain B) TaxID=914234 RepID=M2QZN2_CERS8|nr:hypothetical protein CERSUDRAFT_99732 [Gelatoporia subvermispora B]